MLVLRLFVSCCLLRLVVAVVLLKTPIPFLQKLSGEWGQQMLTAKSSSQLRVRTFVRIVLTCRNRGENRRGTVLSPRIPLSGAVFSVLPIFSSLMLDTLKLCAFRRTTSIVSLWNGLPRTIYQGGIFKVNYRFLVTFQTFFISFMYRVSKLNCSMFSL